VNAASKTEIVDEYSKENPYTNTIRLLCNTEFLYLYRSMTFHTPLFISNINKGREREVL